MTRDEFVEWMEKQGINARDRFNQEKNKSEKPKIVLERFLTKTEDKKEVVLSIPMSVVKDRERNKKLKEEDRGQII